MEAGALLSPSLSHQEWLLCFWDFSWERGALNLLSLILDCDFWVGHCDFSCSPSPGFYFQAGKLLQEHQDPVGLRQLRVTPQ